MKIRKVYLVLSTESARYQEKYFERPVKIEDNANVTVPDSFMIPSNNSYSFKFKFNKKCKSEKQTIIVKSARENWEKRACMRSQFDKLGIDADIYFLIGQAKFDRNSKHLDHRHHTFSISLAKSQTS